MLILARTVSLSVLFIIFLEVLNISKKELPINEEINDKEIRLIDSDGTQLGVVSAKEAQKIADSKNLDLVKIAPQATPPVCRIMDYGKYKFEQMKKEKEKKKNQKVMEVKEIRLSLNIDTHDFNTKANHAVKFLQSGNRVKVSIRYRGRELGHIEAGYPIMERFAEACAEVSNIDKPSKMEGRQMLMFLSPKSSK